MNTEENSQIVKDFFAAIGSGDKQRRALLAAGQGRGGHRAVPARPRRRPAGLRDRPSPRARAEQRIVIYRRLRLLGFLFRGRDGDLDLDRRHEWPEIGMALIEQTVDPRQDCSRMREIETPGPGGLLDLATSTVISFRDGVRGQPGEREARLARRRLLIKQPRLPVRRSEQPAELADGLGVAEHQRPGRAQGVMEQAPAQAAGSTSTKYVYSFGGGKADGNGKMKEVLGGKGAGLAEMTNAGLPVPPGFTIQTEARAGRHW